MIIPYNRKLKTRAGDLRNNATPTENTLWYRFLRKHHCRFLRQKPIDNYIADFYCPSQKLVIEIDGSQHYTEDGLEYDKIRDAVLEAYGLTVLRFTNDDIQFRFQEVCQAIDDFLRK